VSSEEHHVAVPKLYGAPAYARPPRPVEVIERPIDPDDLPLEFLRTADDHELAARMTGSPFAPILAPILTGTKSHGSHGGLQGRPFHLRSLTRRVLPNS
jgi:hypothetical protein